MKIVSVLLDLLRARHWREPAWRIVIARSDPRGIILWANRLGDVAGVDVALAQSSGMPVIIKEKNGLRLAAVLPQPVTTTKTSRKTDEQ